MEVFIPNWLLIAIAIYMLISAINSSLEIHIFFLKRKCKKLDEQNAKLEEEFTCDSCREKNVGLIYSTDKGKLCGKCVPQSFYVNH